jgi:superfamily II DNA or RNA helicase
MSEPARSAPPPVPLHPAAPPIPGLRPAPGFRLRTGQEAFLRKLAGALAAGHPHALGVFVPGYGKTITALAAFAVARALGVARKLVVFVPRQNLRDQYADPAALAKTLADLGAPPLRFCVADSDRVFLKNIDTPVVITTYQYASGPKGHAALARYCKNQPTLFVFDEVHHLADDGLWAQRIAGLDFVASVALSGTPLRSDNKTLFGVPFEDRGPDEKVYVALHEVTLRDAHEEGAILKRVEAHTADYRLRMVRADTQEEVYLSLSALAEIAKDKKSVDAYLARRKLRFHEVYLETLLRPAFERFEEKRRRLDAAMRGAGIKSFRPHQMLVIAMSNKHAEAIHAFVEERFPAYRTGRIGQDVPAGLCAERLEAYRAGALDVMVQVDMIGEGTDIKPISVVVKADLVRAFSKTMQQLFRGMRYYDGWPSSENVCDVYAADDSGVVRMLEWIASEEQAGVRKRTERAAAEGAAPRGQGVTEQSAWELANVEHQAQERHWLALQQGVGTAAPALRVERAEPHAMDVKAKEEALRRECASMAAELARVAGHVPVRDVHARAIRVLGAAQGTLSIRELERKRQWLRRCLQMGRLL